MFGSYILKTNKAPRQLLTSVPALEHVQYIKL